MTPSDLSTLPELPALLVLIFAALALGISAASLAFAVSARRTARDALARCDGHRHVRTAPDRRVRDEGPPDGQPDRRRHRASDDTPRARRGELDRTHPRPGPGQVEPRTSVRPPLSPDPEDVTTTIPAQRPDRPPLPRPGSIRREQ